MPHIEIVALGKTFKGYSVWGLPEDWEKLEFYYLDSGFGGISDNMFTIYATDIEKN